MRSTIQRRPEGVEFDRRLSSGDTCSRSTVVGCLLRDRRRRRGRRSGGRRSLLRRSPCNRPTAPDWRSGVQIDPTGSSPRYPPRSSPSSGCCAHRCAAPTPVCTLGNSAAAFAPAACSPISRRSAALSHHRTPPPLPRLLPTAADRRRRLSTEPTRCTTPINAARRVTPRGTHRVRRVYHARSRDPSSRSSRRRQPVPAGFRETDSRTRDG